MRLISSVKSREDFIRELIDRSTDIGRPLSSKTINFLGNVGVHQVVMCARAVDDPLNNNYDPIQEYSGVDSAMATEIVEAIRDAGFMFTESHESYFTRMFLVKLLGDTINREVLDNYGIAQEYENRVQFSPKRMSSFANILDGFLEPQEAEALVLNFGIKKVYSAEECARVMNCSVEECNRLYGVALAKLWRDKAALKGYGYSFIERQKLAKKAAVTGRRLYRLYLNGGYMEHPFVSDELTAGINVGFTANQ